MTSLLGHKFVEITEEEVEGVRDHDVALYPLLPYEVTRQPRPPRRCSKRPESTQSSHTSLRHFTYLRANT